MSKFIDLTGQKFNMLTVLEKASTINGITTWKCKCDCGNITFVRGGNLKNNLVKSCGCLKHKKRNTHHLSHTKLFRTWNGIKRRCYYTKDKSYPDYGGRGITICDEWKDDFIAFYNWAMENGFNDSLSIERINVDGNYNPQNCRWATAKEQANNRRSCVMISYNGKTQNLTKWCEELDLNYKRVHNRMFKKGWDFEKAINTPVDITKRNKKTKIER